MFFTFKKSNNIFMFLKLVIGWPNFKSQNMATNYKNFYLFSLAKPSTQITFTTKFWPFLENLCLFLTCWLSMDMKYCPTTHPMCATLHFCILVCVRKLSNFSTNFFSLPSILLHLCNRLCSIHHHTPQLLAMVTSWSRPLGTSDLILNIHISPLFF
jgi:hypothetical protein